MTDRLTQALARGQGIYLDLACGPKKEPTAIGLDKRALPGVDLVHDLEVLPWPLPDACCLRILASHIVEHLKPWLIFDILNEAHRVMKDHGQLLIATPYAGSPGFWMDPSHTHGWIESTAMYFDCGHPLWEAYRPRCWQIEDGFPQWQSDGTLHIIFRKRPGEHPHDAPHD
jgi:hypothetical protein